jgi:hypothetical protein
VDSIGNPKLLGIPKTAFLCSRKVPAGIVLGCYDWAIVQRDAGTCVISGFHSTIEKDVFHYLRKGTQPMVVALHRGIGQKIQSDLSADLNNGRLLIISPFDKAKKRGDVRSAEIRNRLMIDLADRIVVGHASAGGQLEKFLSKVNKPIEFL